MDTQADPLSFEKSVGVKSDQDDDTGSSLSIEFGSTAGLPEVNCGERNDAASGKHQFTLLMRNIFQCNAMKQALLLANIGGWYYTNGMNGISMQSFAGEIKGAPFFATCATTAIITCLQLVVGFVLGGGILWIMRRIKSSDKQGEDEQSHKLDILAFLVDIAKRNIRQHSGMLAKKKDNSVLSALHAIGSLATNLGFMFGKASLIQVIKLLEPFETLLLSQILLPTREGAGTCSSGIISSMIVVVGAAMSLLKLQSTPPAPPAVIFAIVSGLSLSCRNVLQRKQHTDKPVQETLPNDDDDTNAPSSDDASKPMSTEVESKLERSIMQFTQLSLISALWTGAAAIVLHVGLWMFLSQPILVAPGIQVLIWHPLYNICSMITLGYVSALTHSLLNAGKRVVAIGMALIWFAEGLPLATVAGLLTVGIGGGWYSWESKQLKKTQQGGGNTPSQGRNVAFVKLMVAISALQILLWIQHRH